MLFAEFSLSGFQNLDHHRMRFIQMLLVVGPDGGIAKVFTSFERTRVLISMQLFHALRCCEKELTCPSHMLHSEEHEQSLPKPVNRIETVFMVST